MPEPSLSGGFNLNENGPGKGFPTLIEFSQGLFYHHPVNGNEEGSKIISIK